METAGRYYLRLAGRILGTGLAISVIVAGMGYFLGWKQPVQYSNAFFWAGAILIVVGLFSVTGGMEQRGNFRVMYTETAGNANIAERNRRTVDDMLQRYSSLVFLVLTGLLLIGVAVAVGTFFTGV